MKEYHYFFSVFGWIRGTNTVLNESTGTQTLQAGFSKGGAVQTLVTANSLASFLIGFEERGAGKWSYQNK